MLIGAFVVGAILGGLAAWLVLRERVRAQRVTAEELTNTFRALSAETLQRTTSSFLDLAKDKIEGVATAQLQPIKESLQRFDDKVERLEQARQNERGQLSEQLLALKSGTDRLRGETASLVGALRASEVRGQWGQLQLENTLQLAGMLEHCDFEQEVSASSDDGLLRPDVVVRLPGGKNIVIDAKVPGLDSLLSAFQSEDEALRSQQLDEFVRLLRDKIRRLSEKAYWRQFMPTPDFVIMFLPSESLYRAAIERDESLMQFGPQQRVILASPTSLIVLLLTAAAAWREQTIADSAREVSAQGQLLYERLAKMNEHFAMLGRSLGRAVEAFNSTLGSLETRVFPAARKLPQLGVSASAEIATVEPIDVAVRKATAPELVGDDGSEHAADAA
jgi:DNA recombination protein RmuC